ncbi:MAG: tRNA pseudouridine(13) synthase TruD [Myxococcales bacterium]|nr:tRNA pseudouridine(13) synthase TruD [Myxococcales bacterium]MCB9736196.1 tRNA pseudouridine(13) synthase TruD [Deltaproteobacteria bacterium]
MTGEPTRSWHDAPTVIPWPGVPLGTGGGLVKSVPEDFEVEEIPAYVPGGSGDFLYLWVEKRDVGAPLLANLVAERLGIDRGAVGMAGMKDRRAVTRQWLSVPAKLARPVEAIEGPVGDGGAIRLLRVERHDNKLKTGHLRGNRFRVRLRGRDPADDGAVATRLEALAARGFPNAYGPQRFAQGRTIDTGLAILRGERLRLSARIERLAVSAVQSVAFNHWLAARAADGLLAAAVPGDVLMKRVSGGIFICEDAAADTARLAAGELVVTGPLPGSKGSRAKGEALAREEAVLAELGGDGIAWGRLGRNARGARRAAVAWPDAVGVARDDDGLVLTFGLPSGSYATVLLAHVVGLEALGEGARDEADAGEE